MSVKVSDIISFFPPVKFVGDQDTTVNRVVQLGADNGNKDVLCWCAPNYVHKLAGLKAGTVILPKEAAVGFELNSCNYIFVENPRKYFNEVLREFFWKPDLETSVSEHAKISLSAKIGKNSFIAAQVIIKDNCVIGDNVRILNNTIIHPDTVIQDNVVIGANNIIGSYGFGYEKGDEGNYKLMPHIGNVVIGSDVEIGNNNCIDRAVLGSTIIKRNSKIHNFVQIAHGVHIGEKCLIAANVTISGSTIIGNDVWVGPGVTVSNKLKIGNHSYLSIGSVVLSDVPDDVTVAGNPGRIIKRKDQ